MIRVMKLQDKTLYNVMQQFRWLNGPKIHSGRESTGKSLYKNIHACPLISI